MQAADCAQDNMTLAALTARDIWLLLADPRVLSFTAETLGALGEIHTARSLSSASRISFCAISASTRVR